MVVRERPASDTKPSKVRIGDREFGLGYFFEAGSEGRLKPKGTGIWAEYLNKPKSNVGCQLSDVASRLSAIGCRMAPISFVLSS